MIRANLILLMILLSTNFAKADVAADLLKASDRGRGGIDEGLTWTIEIQTTEDGETSTRGFIVKAKDHDAYVEAQAPARFKGEIYIFNDRNMWFYKPSVRKPISISSRQKLSGQAANGDIASTHYARDYKPTLIGTDNINGEKVQILLLKANRDNLTYDQIKYYISEKSKLALKVEFLTLQGQVFKVGVMEYNNNLKLRGEDVSFVSRLTITDAKFKENKSVLIYSNPKLDEINNKIFNVNNLSR